MVEQMGRQTDQGLLVAIVVGMALTGAGLVWLIPTVFDDDRPTQTWPIIGLATVFLLLSLAAGRQRRRLDPNLDD